MRPSDVIARATGYLERHDVESPRTTAELLLAGVLDTDRASLYTRSHGLSSAEARRFGRALCRRCTGTPVQHLTGFQGFRRLTLAVRPGVFVPRPETEVLVDVAMELLGARREPLVVDVGTGAGAIALAIADERPDARVVAIDLSSEALALARENAARLDLRIDLLVGDLLQPVAAAPLDLVVSNPPYVREGDLERLPSDVSADPPLALVDQPGLYARLFEQCAERLAAGGGVAVEIEETRAAEVRAYALAAGLTDVTTHPDLAGRDRVISARAS